MIQISFSIKERSFPILYKWYLARFPVFISLGIWRFLFFGWGKWNRGGHRAPSSTSSSGYSPFSFIICKVFYYEWPGTMRTAAAATVGPRTLTHIEMPYSWILYHKWWWWWHSHGLLGSCSPSLKYVHTLFLCFKITNLPCQSWWKNGGHVSDFKKDKDQLVEMVLAFLN